MRLIIDIGTTNITGCIQTDAGLEDFKIFKNSQYNNGADILTRLGCDSSMMQKLILEDLNIILTEYHRSWNEKIDEVIVAGNSVMLALLLNIKFAAIKNFFLNAPKNLKGSDIGLRTAKVIVLPPLERYVGSDALCVLVSSELLKSDENMMVMDLGTNGEIFLGNKDIAFFTSFAGGPAFEYNDTEKSNKNSRIIGTELIGHIYQLIKNGLLDRDGRLNDFQSWPNNFLKIPQLQIRDFQKSKSACITAIQALLLKSDKSVKKFIITGNFGSEININDAIDIGLLPDMPAEFIQKKYMVNAGAAKIHNSDYHVLTQIYSRLKYVAIERDAIFLSNFIPNLILKPIHV